MRKLITVGALAVAWAIPVGADAQERKSDVHGFAGVSAGTATFGSAVSSTFGGRVGIGITPHLQAVGEAGRLARFESPAFNFLDVAFSVRVSAFYGEGGIRWIVSPHSSVRPYGEVTAGFARLNAGAAGLDASNQVIDAALNQIDTTRPIAGLGGGVLLQAGPVSFDVGYRYKEIFAGDSVAATLNDGHNYHVNQVRVGVGYRF
jgi:hypothetical protein